MKTIIILANEITPRLKTTYGFLKKNLNKNAKVLLKTFHEISFKIQKSEVDCYSGDLNIKDCSVVYFNQTAGYTQLAGTIGYLLKKSKIKFIDESFENLGAANNKLGNIVKLALANVPIVPSFYASRKNLLNLRKTVVKEFGYPIFAKSLTKQRRQGIFIIKRPEDFNKLLKAYRDSRGFLLQKYIDVAKEFRLVVMGNRVAALHEEAKRQFKGNRIQVDSEESQTGWLDPSIAPREMTDAVVRGAEALGLNIAGADGAIERKTGKIYIFEINRGPGLTLDPKVSPELPELAKYMSDLLKK